MANRRFEMHQYRHILVRMRLGETDRQIARAGLMGRPKAAAVRRQAQIQGWLDPAWPLPDDDVLAQTFDLSNPRSQSLSHVLPFEREVRQWHGQGIQGTTIHEALVRKHGFTGSYSSVRRFLQALQLAEPEVTTVLDFEPGDCAQVDFGRGPRIVDVRTGEIIDTWIFTMVLAWSRHLYAELVTDQSVPTWLGCHRRAFEFFGGVPSRLVIDNLKAAIARACYHDPAVQRAYAELAEGYGFRLAPLPVRQPQMKGRIEAGVKYVKRRFVPLRDFRDMADGNAQLKAWLLGPAGNRIHGTTQERPLTRFAEVERFLLKPLPPRPVELAEWAKVKVHGDCHVQFAKCRYSVPYRLVRQRLWLRAAETNVRVYRDHELVAIHPRRSKPGSRSTLDEHLPPEALAYKMQDPQWCLKQAQAVGPHCYLLVDTLFAHRVLDNLRAAQGVVRLGKTYGHQRLEAACARALAFDSALYRTVKTILEKGADQEPLPTRNAPPLEGPYTGQGRFCRDTSQLLTTTTN
jgi:transposase